MSAPRSVVGRTAPQPSPSSASARHLGKYFVIRNVRNSRLVLEVSDLADAPVVVVTSRSTLTSSSAAAAKRRLWTMNDETGTICSRFNGYCLDTDCAGERLIVSPYRLDASSQRWVVCDGRIQTLDDFEMVISSAAAAAAVGEHDVPCEIRGDVGADGQLWTFDYVPAEYFLIRSVHDPRKVLDVRGADTRPGARIIAYVDKGDGSDNQLWYEDRHGFVRSKLNGFVIDATGGDVTLQPFDVGNPQHHWTISSSSVVNRLLRPPRQLEMQPSVRTALLHPRHGETPVVAAPVDEDDAAASGHRLPASCRAWTVDDGHQLHHHHQQQQQQQQHSQLQQQQSGHSGSGKYFVVRSRIAGGPLLEIQSAAARQGTPVMTSSPGAMIELGGGGNSLQTFYVDEMTSSIRTNLNGYCLDVKDDMVVVSPYDNTSDTQRWSVVETRIVQRRRPDNVLTLTSSTSDPGATTVTVRPYDGSTRQLWDVIHLPPKYFVIVSQLNGKVVDVRSNDAAAGAKVIMFDRKSPVCANQLWYEDERGVIRSKLNGFVMDSSSADGQIRMQPYDPTSARHQLWTIVGDRIQNRQDAGTVLDIARASTKNGAHLCTYAFHCGANQRWTFEYVV